MSKLKVAIIDDEPIARAGLMEYCQTYEQVEVVGTYEEISSYQQDDKRPDLLFMDIEMPGMTGIEFLRSTAHRPAVILITAYSEYAIESYQLDVLDYLLKPVSQDRFHEAIQKAFDYKRSTGNQEMHAWIKTGAKMEKISLSDILYVESMQNYVSIYYNDDRKMLLMPLKKLLPQLPPHIIKVHKSYAVNVSKVKGIEGFSLRIGRASIPISRDKKKEIVQIITKGDFLE